MRRYFAFVFILFPLKKLVKGFWPESGLEFLTKRLPDDCLWVVQLEHCSLANSLRQVEVRKIASADLVIEVAEVAFHV